MMILVTGGASSGKSAYAEQVACALPAPHFYLAAMKPFGEEGARRIARHRALRAGKGFITIECYDGLDAVAGSVFEACSTGPREAEGEADADLLKLTARRSDGAAAELDRFAVSDSPRSRSACAPRSFRGSASASPSPSCDSSSRPVRGTALLESLGNVVANAQFANDGSCATYGEALKTVMEGVASVAETFENLVIVGDEVGGDGMRYDDATETYIKLIGSAACAIAARCDVVVECVAGQPLVIKGDCPF